MRTSVKSCQSSISHPQINWIIVDTMNNLSLNNPKTVCRVFELIKSAIIIEAEIRIFTDESEVGS